jgi:hypothetical protein
MITSVGQFATQYPTAIQLRTNAARLRRSLIQSPSHCARSPHRCGVPLRVVEAI